MKLSEFKEHLSTLQQLNLQLPGGIMVPGHFHITEAGLVTRHFIDCGTAVRTEKHINFQVWVANDPDHRLEPAKLLRIIESSAAVIGTEDLDVEIEYQTDTIGRYGLEPQDGGFSLTAKQTACLASDECGVPREKTKLNLIQLTPEAACCTPGGSCC